MEGCAERLPAAMQRLTLALVLALLVVSPTRAADPASRIKLHTAPASAPTQCLRPSVPTRVEVYLGKLLRVGARPAHYPPLTAADTITHLDISVEGGVPEFGVGDTYLRQVRVWCVGVGVRQPLH